MRQKSCGKGGKTVRERHTVTGRKCVCCSLELITNSLAGIISATLFEHMCVEVKDAARL